MNATNTINIGVLGCANIAQKSVIPAILELKQMFVLRAIASREKGKADLFANNFNCNAIEGYDKLINSPEIDAIYIPLPSGLHKEWVNKALSAGKHVYAEKSLAICNSDAEFMVANARHNDLALMEGFMFQYHSQHEIVLNLIKSNAIGELRHFFSSFGFPPLPEDNFRYNEDIGGGVLMDAAGYPLRAAHFVLGNGLKVEGATLYFDPKIKTCLWGSAFLSGANGLGASISFGFDNYYQCRYEIWGAKGKIVAERAFTPQPNFSPRIMLETTNGSELIEAAPDNHFVKAFVEFYNTIFSPIKREKHYSDILTQSQSLDLIYNLARPIHKRNDACVIS